MVKELYGIEIFYCKIVRSGKNLSTKEILQRKLFDTLVFLVRTIVCVDDPIKAAHYKTVLLAEEHGSLPRSA